MVRLVGNVTLRELAGSRLCVQEQAEGLQKFAKGRSHTGKPETSTLKVEKFGDARLSSSHYRYVATKQAAGLVCRKWV
jgi:hypothetical protein